MRNAYGRATGLFATDAPCRLETSPKCSPTHHGEEAPRLLGEEAEHSASRSGHAQSAACSPAADASSAAATTSVLGHQLTAESARLVQLADEERS